jgi:ABC-type dipeptide/oligopeptide/nickel transport system permease component
MRHALRRILWIVPTLVVISIAAFWLLSATLGWTPAAEPGLDPSAARQRLEKLPRFFNAEPENVRDLATEATRRIAAGGPGARAARGELARLGGAALPHVLPRLDALPPSGRGRVALALAPVARRMGVGSPAELGVPGSAVVFWTRYWQERAIDFRPAIVHRLVQRVAERSSLMRREDIAKLDTYALPELIHELGNVETPEDAARVQRLSALAAHVTGLSWTLADGATVVQARSVAARWRQWWSLNRSRFITFDGPGRVSAMLIETQYGKWAAEAVRNRLGVSLDGQPVLDEMIARAPVTLLLVGSGLFGGYALGILLGLLAASRAGKPSDHIASALAVGIVALPVATLAASVAPGAGQRGSYALAAILVLVVSGALVSRYQRAATLTALDQDYSRTRMAFGASRLRVALGSFRASSTPAISLLGVDLPMLGTTAFVVEQIFHLPGLGPATLRAVSNHDLPWLMAMALLGALGVALVQIASDLLLLWLDPRIRAADARNRGAFG